MGSRRENVKNIAGSFRIFCRYRYHLHERIYYNRVVSVLRLIVFRRRKNAEVSFHFAEHSCPRHAFGIEQRPVLDKQLLLYSVAQTSEILTKARLSYIKGCGAAPEKTVYF